jgi:16S rRNA (cytosine1402-N4)-methyltransferase
VSKDFTHLPVLREEVLELLAPEEGEKFCDLTVGLGGHSELLAERVGEAGLLLGIDCDRQALTRAEQRLADLPQVQLRLGRFSQIARIHQAEEMPPLDGILADLGVSSLQLDDGRRGFSFRKSAPLDMRLDRSRPISAKDLVNKAPEAELAKIFSKFGEERGARKIAQEVASARPLRSTLELAELVERVAPRRPGERIHPATKVFQALRIAVNDELGELEKMLPAAFKLLAPGGRLAVISFHSLEDRLVKNFFRQVTARCLCPPESPVCCCSGSLAELVNKKVIQASAAEISENPRARSARLRVLRRNKNPLPSSFPSLLSK